jgi:hypothetical protein
MAGYRKGDILVLKLESHNFLVLAGKFLKKKLRIVTLEKFKNQKPKSHKKGNLPNLHGRVQERGYSGLVTWKSQLFWFGRENSTL